jgi:hypothetical protein
MFSIQTSGTFVFIVNISGAIEDGEVLALILYSDVLPTETSLTQVFSQVVCLASFGVFLTSELRSQEEPKGTFTAVDVVVSFILNTVGVVSQLTLSGIAFIRHR